jgi:hypothetical protein
MNTKLDPIREYLPHAAMLWIAEIIEAETPLGWKDAKNISQRIMDEIASSPELFQ